MRLHTDYVVDSLQGYVVEAYPDRDALPDSFARAELYLGQDAEADVLYIVDAKQLPEQGKHSFLVTAAKDSPTIPALYAAGIDAVRAFNAVTRHVAQISVCLEDLRNCYYGQHDLQAFCQHLADFVGNPVVAYDDAVLPIAQSAFPPEYAHDQFGADGINYEYVFKAIPDWMKEDAAFVVPEDGFSTVGAFRTFTRDGKGSTVTCRIAVDGKPVGLLDIFEANKPASDGDMRLLEEACRILEAPLPFEDNRFFESRLKGLTTQSDLTDIWLSALKWHVDDEVFVVAVNLPPVFSNSMHNLDRAMRVLRSLVPSSVCVQMGAVPVLVANNRFASRQRVLDTIASFLKTTGTEYYLGASELLVGVGNLHEGYVHAQFAAQFAMRRSGVSGTACFEECQFSFFRNLCSLEENKDLVLDAAVLRMHGDDLAAGTDNVLTAKAYIESGFNLNATAKAVSVHRNTVAYRLKHIAERYGVDLSTPVDDPGLVFRVLLSCKLLLGDS